MSLSGSGSEPFSEPFSEPLSDLPRLATLRLVLVPMTLDAVRALVAGADPGLPLASGYPHADTLYALALQAGADEVPVAWFVVHAESGAVIGDCGAKGPPDEAGRLEIGYGLAAAYRGRGYGGEAVAAMVRWLVGQDEVRSVVAEVEVGNIASRRLLERIGFVLDETAGGLWRFGLAR